MAKDSLSAEGRSAVQHFRERRKVWLELCKLKDTKIARLEAKVDRLENENKRLRDELKKSKAV